MGCYPDLYNHWLAEQMNPTAEIPREALSVHHNSSGFLPQVGLHRRGDLFRQESSYSHFWLSGVLLACAVVLALLPWHTRANVGGELKYWVAGILVFGCVCSVVPYFIRNAWGQTITIDPKKQTLCITTDDFSRKLTWEQVIGLQICRRKVPRDSEMNGYQLNLVWRDAEGAVRRHCLLQHSLRGFAVRLARRYESLFAFRLIDHTRKSQPDGAASGSQPIRPETNRTSLAAGSRR
jgi:hypothetical protein